MSVPPVLWARVEARNLRREHHPRTRGYRLPSIDSQPVLHIALNDIPIDVLALQLGSNRNAIYKNLFDARCNLRVALASAGHPVIDEDALS